MSKRGRRRSSRRRKSSSGKSSSPYNKQDTSCSCGRRDETRNDHVDQNILSGSEKKRKCSNKEEEKEEDAQMNLLSVPNIVYMKTTEDKEKGVKITTSLSVSDMKDSFPKITLQLSHELSPENPPATSLSDAMRTKGFGLRLNLEMKERTELTGCAVKSDLRFVYGDDCEEPPNDESLERPSQPWTREAGSPPLAQEDSRYLHTSTVWESPSVSQCFGGHHRRASTGPHSPLSPHATRKRLHRNVETDHCWNFSPIQQPSAHLTPLKSTAVDDVAFSGINQRRFHAAPTVSSDSGTRFPAAPLFPGCDRQGCALQRPQGNVSLVGDYVRYPKRRSWIQTSGQHRGCLFPMKRCHTFPGMSEALGIMHEELVLPYHGCVLSLIMNSLPFNTLRLANIHQEKIQLSSFGSRKPQHPQSMWSSKSIPDDQDMKICHLKHCGPQTLRRYRHQDDREGDSRTCRELEGEHLSPEQLTEKLRLLNMRVVHPALCHPLRCPPAGEQEGASVEPQPDPTRIMQLSSGLADGSYAGNHTLASVEHTSTFPPATPVQSNQRSEDPNDLLDTEKQRREEKLKGQQRASCSAKNPADKQEEKMAKVEETGHQGPSRLSIDSSQHLRPVDGSVSDHWAVKRKLFRENKQWSSAGGSSITSDMTEEQASEDSPSLDTIPQDEDRGFYAETFYSSAWVYQGDDSSGVIPPSLNSRTRAVSIRERTVKVSKGTGEYPWGFRIQFSKPIVVTEVDTNGAAEEAGLMVGDYVLAVNGTDVTSIPHSEAANLARQGPDLLTLTIGSDIARYPSSPRPACRGYLYKRTQSGLIKGWRKRWFVLTHECCLYYYRHRRDEGQQRPLQALRLEGAEVRPDTSLGKPFVFKCCPQAATRVFFFSATSSQEMKRWLEAMEKAIRPITQNHVWEDVTRHNCSLPPLAVKNPECLGLLHKLDRSRDTWVQHYCILKDGCLSFYSGIRATHAQGGIYLQGYTVKEQPYGSKKSSIELKPPSDEFKTFYFCAENATENKRWILALKTSVKKWLPLHRALQDYMSRPPEETRM